MMGNKKKRYVSPNTTKPQNPLPPVTVADLQAEDDPYWQVFPESNGPVPIRYIEKFQREMIRYPQWAEDLMRGIPTYYGVLRVLRGASAEQLLLHHEQEMNFSPFPDDTIEEAYDVLSQTASRIKYDEFLHLFCKICQPIPPEHKAGLIEVHHSLVQKAKLFHRMRKIQESYADYFIMVAQGMPDIFSFSGLSRDCSGEDIRNYSDGGDEVSQVIASIMGDPVKRDDFMLISDFPNLIAGEDGKKSLAALKKKGKSIDPSLVSRVLLMTLTGSNQFGEIITRCGEILQDNHDWIAYLPPSSDTFFSLLGVAEDICLLPKSQMESELRSRYRTLERTPQVNLAYTILKSQKLRDDYLWMQKNYDFMLMEKALQAPKKKLTKKEKMEQMFRQMNRRMNWD
ncbi:MAG: hypothetical protein V1862_06070 [Methanobacteriota archaeon]